MTIIYTALWRTEVGTGATALEACSDAVRSVLTDGVHPGVTATGGVCQYVGSGGWVDVGSYTAADSGGTPPPPPPPGGIVCGGGGTCTLIIAPYVATADDYAAVSIIFGAVLVAACAIWGAKQILRLFRERGQE